MSAYEPLSQEQWQIVKELVNQLLELPAEQAAAQLTEWSAADSEHAPQVMAQVKALMAVHLDPDAATISPQQSAAAVISAQDQLLPGQSFGKYTIAKHIGAGGMGHVYQAYRDDEVHQQVAIKVINKGALDPQSLARFDNERRILASLEHPNITRLIDAGTEGGHAYYVMEYVDGVAIDVYCQQQRLDLAGRLRLFLAICDAVRYAHNNLIVHRDLKPSNVLVDAEGQVKLLDFGIAKPLKVLPGTDQMHETLVGTMSLTPQYAAPEQINGDVITVACDIYLLGLLLYRMLTDQHAFDLAGQTWGTIDHVINHALPPLPSEGRKQAGDTSIKAPQLRGDLDSITCHALNKAPNERYLSVTDLIADIKAFLHAEPIAVRTNQRWYRFKKNLRKHWLMVTATSLVIGTLLVAILFIRQERDIAIKEKQRAEVISETFVNAFKNADPTKNNGADISALDIVDQTRLLMSQRQDDDTGVNADLSLAIVEVYLNLDAYRQALDVLQQIKPQYANLSEANQVTYHARLIEATLPTAFTEVKMDALLEQALREVGPHKEILYVKAKTLRLLVRYKEAVEAIEMYWPELASTDPLYLPTCTVYGYVLLSDDQYAKAEAVLNGCAEFIESQGVENHVWELAQINFRLGRMNINKRNYPLAVEKLKRSVELKQQIFAKDHLEVAESDIFLSDALLGDGQFEQAKFHADRGYEIRLNSAMANGFDAIKTNANVAKPMFRIGNYHLAVKEYDRAKEIYLQVIQYRKDAGIEHLYNTSEHYKKLGQVNCHLGLLEEAITAYDNAMMIIQQPKYNYFRSIVETELLKAECWLKFQHRDPAAEIIQRIGPEVKQAYSPDFYLVQQLKELEAAMVEE